MARIRETGPLTRQRRMMRHLFRPTLDWVIPVNAGVSQGAPFRCPVPGAIVRGVPTLRGPVTGGDERRPEGWPGRGVMG